MDPSVSDPAGEQQLEPIELFGPASRTEALQLWWSCQRRSEAAMYVGLFVVFVFNILILIDSSPFYVGLSFLGTAFLVAVPLNVLVAYPWSPGLAPAKVRFLGGAMETDTGSARRWYPSHAVRLWRLRGQCLLLLFTDRHGFYLDLAPLSASAEARLLELRDQPTVQPDSDLSPAVATWRSSPEIERQHRRALYHLLPRMWWWRVGWIAVVCLLSVCVTLITEFSYYRTNFGYLDFAGTLEWTGRAFADEPQVPIIGAAVVVVLFLLIGWYSLGARANDQLFKLKVLDDELLVESPSVHTRISRQSVEAWKWRRGWFELATSGVLVGLAIPQSAFTEGGADRLTAFLASAGDEHR